jgi:hypothetical protein
MTHIAAGTFGSEDSKEINSDSSNRMRVPSATRNYPIKNKAEEGKLKRRNQTEQKRWCEFALKGK